MEPCQILAEVFRVMSDHLEREGEETHMEPSTHLHWEEEEEEEGEEDIGPADNDHHLEWEGEEISLISDLQRTTTSTDDHHRFPQVELEVRMTNGHIIHQNGSREGSPLLASVVLSEPDGGSLSCRRGKNAPDKMRRGAAAVCGSTAYFNSSNSHQVYSFRITENGEKWSRLPRYPHRFFSLAVVGGLVTGIGGMSSKRFRNLSMCVDTLLSLTGEGEGLQWSEVYPPMPTARGFTAAVATPSVLVVAGGGNKEVKVNIVEVMDITTRQWSTACSLPQPLTSLTGVIHGDQLFLGGFFYDYGSTFFGHFSPSQLVLTCPLSSLTMSPSPNQVGVASDVQRGVVSDVQGGVVSQSPRRYSGVWKTVSKLPVTCTTLAVLGDSLVAVGGEIGDMYKADMYSYDPRADSWAVIGRLKHERSLCLAAVVPGNQLVVVGGLYCDWLSGLTRTDSVEIVSMS